MVLVRLLDITKINMSPLVSIIMNCRNGEKIEYCRTHHVMNQLKSNPAYLKVFNKVQSEVQKEELKIRGGSNKSVVYTIPVVFHVLHNGGVENISKAQISNSFFLVLSHGNIVFMNL